jgi:hypothetical protein
LYHPGIAARQARQFVTPVEDYMPERVEGLEGSSEISAVHGNINYRMTFLPQAISQFLDCIEGHGGLS